MAKKKNIDKIDPDWWLTEEILPPDPWAYIVSDFQWGWEIVYKIKDFKYKQKPIGHYPNDTSRSRQSIEFALNTIIQLNEKVRSKISNKECDLEFVWIWGEYQKALAILEISYPQYARTNKARAEAQKRSKDDARKWYALWYDWYKEKNGKGRENFDDYFEELIKEIRLGKRQILNTHEIDDVLDLAEKYVHKPNKPDDHRLTNSFRLNGFNSDKFLGVLEKAKKEKDSFPAIGEENYKLI